MKSSSSSLSMSGIDSQVSKYRHLGSFQSKTDLLLVKKKKRGLCASPLELFSGEVRMLMLKNYDEKVKIDILCPFPFLCVQSNCI